MDLDVLIMELDLKLGNGIQLVFWQNYEAER